jgi:uncharacterized protein (DUF1330 family)
MPAYIIASYDITDPDGYERYLAGVVPLLEKHGAEVLVADHEAQAFEGDKRSTCIVLRFDSEVAALAWYNDPAYAPLRKLRLDASRNGSLALCSGFVPPGA